MAALSTATTDTLHSRLQQLPPLLPPEEYFLDTPLLSRLQSDSKIQVNELKQQIRDDITKQQIIQKRMKKRFWSGWEVVARTLESLRSREREAMKANNVDTKNQEEGADKENNDRNVEDIAKTKKAQQQGESSGRPTTAAPVITEIPAPARNYPIRKADPTRQQEKQQILTLRKAQILLNAATKQQGLGPSIVGVVISEEGELLLNNNAKSNEENANASDEKSKPSLEFSSLLYDSFQLTTTLRRRTQIILLREILYAKKLEFNALFNETVKQKQKQMQKITEKNEKIKALMAELGIEEELYEPVLSPEEDPSSLITVLDSEVKVEKVLTAAENAALAQKLKEQEERRLASQSDNWKERALNAMMGGKLEERSEREGRKAELVRPDWMNKAAKDMSEDEIKQTKEFDRKFAMIKDEIEKERKALETEFRKTQGDISDIVTAFDKEVSALYEAKLQADESILKIELQIVRLVQILYFEQFSEEAKLPIIQQIRDLSKERVVLAGRAAESKRKLTLVQEENDIIVRADKDVEKAFRKEFPANDAFQSAAVTVFRMKEEVRKESHCPEDLSSERWDRLLELRKRKLVTEDNMNVISAKLQDAQLFVNNVVAESDQVSDQIAKATTDWERWCENKFNLMYDMEGFFQLKQGQVEVPQQTITEYSQAVLIDRSFVGAINDHIIDLATAKVEALKEMKDYSKGIHALEWESKMLDFQAESQLMRIRDIQLLLVTKDMQEYIRSGTNQTKHAAEIAMLERRLDHTGKQHDHDMANKQNVIEKLFEEQKQYALKNAQLDKDVVQVEETVVVKKQQQEIQDRKLKEVGPERVLQEIMERRKLKDLSKSQAQEIEKLKQQVAKMRARTYPNFTSVYRD